MLLTYAVLLVLDILPALCILIFLIKQVDISLLVTHHFVAGKKSSNFGLGKHYGQKSQYEH